MRFANVNGRAALLEQGRYLDLHDASHGRISSAPGEFLMQWSESLEIARSLDRSAWQPLDGAALGAPVPAPTQSIGVGLNYADHVAESGNALPAFPLIFAKLAGSLCGPADDVLLPTEYVDWEAELVVVLGAQVDRASAAEAADAIAGYMVGQDFSERRVQRQIPGGQHTIGKSFRTFGPVGPAMVTVDELGDADDLAISCSVNGEIVQSGRTSEMLVASADLIAQLSARLPLGPGDLIFTGTPAGIGSTRVPPRFLRPGDVVVTEVERIGVLTNRCVADPNYPGGA
jgi:2-keto-4-pentenoate hydratase/2-oxohepta-3-ene-1,7-dioic acid hydratase in catechol pathway